MGGEVETQILKTIIYGVEKALWEGMGEACLAFTPLIGESICEEMRGRARVDFSKASVEEIVAEIGRLMREHGVSEKFDITVSGNEIAIDVKGCTLLDVERRLIRNGIRPFICPFLNATAYVLRKRLGLKSRIKRIDVYVDKGVCRLEFTLLE